MSLQFFIVLVRYELGHLTNTWGVDGALMAMLLVLHNHTLSFVEARSLQLFSYISNCVCV